MTVDTRFTLAMEQMLLHPQFAELAQHCSAILGTAVADQHGAANHDARHLADQLGNHFDGTQIGGGPDKVPGWRRLGVIETWIGHCSGTADTGRHNPNIRSPQPVVAAAWKPGLIACGACVQILAPRRNSVEDRTCDACGHECAGCDADDPIYPSVVQFGSLIYQFGVCTSCRNDTLAAA